MKYGTCQICEETVEVDVRVDNIVRHEILGKRCKGSYLPTQEFMLEAADSYSVTIFRGVIA